MNIRRVLLDVDKAIQRPEIIDIAQAIDASPGVTGLNITVTEIDVQTVGMDVTVEEDGINLDAPFPPSAGFRWPGTADADVPGPDHRQAAQRESRCVGGGAGRGRGGPRGGGAVLDIT